MMGEVDIDSTCSLSIAVKTEDTWKQNQMKRRSRNQEVVKNYWEKIKYIDIEITKNQTKMVLDEQ